MKSNANIELKENCGSDFLVPKDKWVEPIDLYGEKEVLLSPVIELAFNRILEDFQPCHKTAFLSLCTKSRPYSTSTKWKAFMGEFSNDSDLIVCSNGGIIPQKYWGCYPYLTYNAPHVNEKYTDLYVDVLYERLIKFFEKKHYDRIIFNFRPGLRNRIAAERFVESCVAKESEIFILPTEDAFQRAKQRGFNHGKLLPDLDDYVMDELREAVGVVKPKPTELW